MTNRLQPRRIEPAPPAQAVPRAALYTRVSTDMQVEAESLGTQQKQLQEYCAYHKLEVHELYTDAGISGAHTENRPAFQKMMKDAREGKFTIVVVARIDRISRNLSDLLDLIHTLEDLRIDFISISQQFDTSTPMGRLTLNILGSFAQFERDIIAERTRENMLERAKRGKWNGGVIPYGFKVVNDQLEPEATEVDFVRLMYREYRRQRSLRSVAVMLNALDAKPRYRNGFTGNAVKQILMSPLYRGAACYNKRKMTGTTSRPRPKGEWVIVDGVLPPIVTPEIWHEVNRLLEANDGINHVARRSQYLLSGLLRCGTCGHHLQGRMSNKPRPGSRKVKKIHYYYICYTHSQKGGAVCDQQMVRTDAIDRRVIAGLAGIATNPEPIIQRAEALLQTSTGEQARLCKDDEALKIRIAALDEKLQRWNDAYGEGGIDKAEYLQRTRPLRSELDIVRQQRDQVRTKLTAIESGSFDRTGLSAQFNAFADAFHYLPIGEQKAILHNLVDHIVLHRDGNLDIFIYQPVISEIVWQGGDIGASDLSAPLVRVTVPPEGKPPLEPLSSFPSFAARVHYLREREGLAKSVLAAKLGVHETTVANWEIRDLPAKKQVVRRVAEFFGVSYADLAGTPSVPESAPPQERLRLLREHYGYTQREFAGLIGMTIDSYIWREVRPRGPCGLTENAYQEMKAKAEAAIAAQVSMAVSPPLPTGIDAVAAEYVQTLAGPTAQDGRV